MSSGLTNTIGSNVHDFSVFSQMRKNIEEAPDQAVKQVAQQFESLFVQMMLKSMRDSVQEGGLFDNSNMDTYMQMHDQQLSLSLSEKGGIGLADTIVKQLGSDKKLPLDSASSLSAEGMAVQNQLVRKTDS
ncbi:rod-binding protein [Spongiibacter pelagi]|nr:rod-binding protein [Spongiibacter pelagi]